MDYSKLRAQTLRDGDDEEAVTVNTRALIDKVLARYSGEWTTLRELLQNAADAQASSVSIRFETIPSAHIPLSNTTDRSSILQHVLLNHTLRRLLVSNDGQAFGVKDWDRLKRIAEGNPDETKIGAFGVGFYSVFADCEEPFVSSGDKTMAFYWKGNSLFTRKGKIPEEQRTGDTCFVLEYRNTTTPMPNLLSIAQFLATSLTFVALQKVDLWVDDYQIIKLEKKAAPSIDVPIARDVETKSKEGLMKVQSMERESVQMDATFMNVVGWKPTITSAPRIPGSFDGAYGSSSSDVPSLRSFFSRLTSSTSHAQLKTKAMKEEKAFQDIVLEDLTALTTANVFLRVTTAMVRTSVSASFAAELERATKKPPPKTTRLAILTSSYDESAASSKENLVAKGVDVFASVLPGKKPGGRIFIGFPTHQTTGAGMHLSAPSVIPTVERESIDLNARWVRTWNQEMLRVAGIMARLAFADEMADLSVKLKRAAEKAGHGTKVGKEEIAQFLPEALHTLKTFTFGESTPSSQVAQLIEEAFWTAYKKPSIEIFSTRGVLPTTTVRLATEDLSGFVEGIPVVPDELVNGPFVTKLKDFGLISEITIGDVKQELEAKALSKEQLVQFIGWAGKKAITGDIDGPTIHSLLDVAVASTGVNFGSAVIMLGSITNYLNVSKIPAEVPIPPTTMPFQFTRSTSPNELQALGWEPLEIVPWLRWLVETDSSRGSEERINSNIPFAAHVLQILSKAWDGLSQTSKGTVVFLLQPVTIVPTKSGMRKPGEAFFPSVKIFDDLPTITRCPGVKDKFFAAIGVRKTVDLDTIFARLGASEGQSGEKRSANNNHMEIIKYLASVQNDLPQEDIKRLKNTPICPAEAGPKGMESTKGTERLYKISELYEPKDALRDLRLPILQWPGPPGSYRPSSKEGFLLNTLGIRSAPSVPELVKMMSSADLEHREKARTYFIANHHINGYANFAIGSSSKAFLPLEGDEKRLVSPAECFTNQNCSVLGFSILKKDLQLHANKFGVALDPPITDCVNRLLAKPPQSRREATTLFTYFTSRLGDLGQNSVAKLADAPIVPVLSGQSVSKGIFNEKSQSDLRHLTPRQCYIGDSETFGDIFEFVNFGDDANMFLLKCGSKNEPTKLELAALVSREPARVLGVVQAPEKYLNLLRLLADDLSSIKRDKKLFQQLKSAKFLLGSIEILPKQEARRSKQGYGGDDQQDSDPEDTEIAPVKQFQLALASQIVVSDDYVGYRLFRASLICAPEEEKLEAFYHAFGAQKMSDLLQEDLRLGSPAEKQHQATQIRAHILERSKLFLHDQSRENRDNIRHDSRWLEKNLSVQVVSSIALRRSLTGYNLSHTEKRAAACQHERGRGYTLYITAGSSDTYQIAQSICPLLLERPTQGAGLILESMLSLSLLQLRSRGVNVQRILNAKAAEQRIAEEQRKKQLEAEQAQIREQEQAWKQQNALVPSTPAGRERTSDKRMENQMPGAFGDSPEHDPMPVAKSKKQGLFSNFTKRLGINSGGEDIQEQLSNFLGGGGSSSQSHGQGDNPPPYSDDLNANKGMTKAGTGGEKVSSPAAVQQNLLNAIQSSRAHDSNTLFSPPTTSVIKEQATYCDSTPANNIMFLADAANGTRIFVSKNLATPHTAFLAENVQALNAFSNLLQEVGDVYALPRKAMHIYFDEGGNTIAFNSSGSVFCNFRFYQQLQQKKVDSGLAEGKVEAAAYWWIVLAHELAHNLVKEHNAEHSFYT